MVTTISARTFTASLAICAFGLLGATTAAADNFKQIKTEADFREQVVGKKLLFGDDYVLVKSNGTLRGNFGGKNLKGAWEWRDAYFCRTLTTHSKNTDCQLWTVSGNQHKVTRARGKGKSFVYTEK